MSGKLTTPTVLKKIIDRKVEEVSARKAQISIGDLRAQAAEADPVRGGEGPCACPYVKYLWRECITGLP
jgi:hypothetical protein